MSNLFLAVQCFQCSTMQVKQQKKSSNKWVCVVCNQRQSMQRIHARGFLAKDVRQFVQAFNISRMKPASDGLLSVGASGGSEVDDCDTAFRRSPSSAMGVGRAYRSQRRTDWREYLDPKLDGEEEEEGDEDRVTKLPPKTSGRPFQKCPPTVSAKKEISTPKRTQDGAQQAERIASKKCRKTSMEEGGSSRWSEFLKEDETDEGSECEGDARSPCTYRDWSGNNFQTSELRVEEEVHPDFQ